MRGVPVCFCWRGRCWCFNCLTVRTFIARLTLFPSLCLLFRSFICSLAPYYLFTRLGPLLPTNIIYHAYERYSMHCTATSIERWDRFVEVKLKRPEKRNTRRSTHIHTHTQPVITFESQATENFPTRIKTSNCVAKFVIVTNYLDMDVIEIHATAIWVGFCPFRLIVKCAWGSIRTVSPQLSEAKSGKCTINNVCGQLWTQSTHVICDQEHNKSGLSSGAFSQNWNGREGEYRCSLDIRTRRALYSNHEIIGISVFILVFSCLCIRFREANSSRYLLPPHFSPKHTQLWDFFAVGFRFRNKSTHANVW